jgi:hypothetical protein
LLAFKATAGSLLDRLDRSATPIHIRLHLIPCSRLVTHWSNPAVSESIPSRTAG